MVKLMLVDDEDVVRHQVINKIDWAQYGFEIVCEAENGNDAFELFEIHKPDVVITDIKMPFMDGLELSEKILKKYPYTKIIVLTGFDEFEYAKKGIDLHIMHYILKPISSKELIKILTEVKSKIDAEIEQIQNVERLKRHYEQSYPLMRDKFLDGLVQGIYNDEAIDEWLSYYEISLKGQLYMVSVIQIDNNYEVQKSFSLNEMELQKISLFDVVKDVDERYHLGTFFLGNREIVILSSTESDDIEAFVSGQINKLETLRQGVEKFLPFTVTIGCGRVCKNLEDLSQSKSTASNACDYKLSIGENQVIFINDIEPTNLNSYEITEADQKNLGRILRIAAQQDYKDFIESIFNRLSQMDDQSRQMYLLELFAALIRTTMETNVDFSEVIFNDAEVPRLFEQSETLSFKKSKFLAIGEAVMNHSSDQRKTSNSSLVDQAKAYVLENYKDWDLNIEKISAHLHYSPNYFSSMFKKETGQAFMNYLSDLRIELAKELLLTTDMKNFEIALEVGFSSANYFSFCFKKAVELSPSGYKKVYQNKA